MVNGSILIVRFLSPDGVKVWLSLCCKKVKRSKLWAIISFTLAKANQITFLCIEKPKAMKNIIELFDWRPELLNQPNVDSIGEDFILLDKPIILSGFEYPFKVDVVTAIICMEGETKGKVDLKPYHSTAPSMIIIMPGQILQIGRAHV